MYHASLVPRLFIQGTFSGKVISIFCTLINNFRSSFFIRSLAEFQTRKARRVHIRDKDLLKYWFVCLLMVIIYLAAYTSITLNLVSTQNANLVSAADIFSDAKCMPFWWSYVTQISKHHN